jgi:hypothetical protein
MYDVTTKILPVKRNKLKSEDSSFSGKPRNGKLISSESKKAAPI